MKPTLKLSDDGTMTYESSTVRASFGPKGYESTGAFGTIRIDEHGVHTLAPDGSFASTPTPKAPS